MRDTSSYMTHQRNKLNVEENQSSFFYGIHLMTDRVSLYLLLILLLILQVEKRAHVASQCAVSESQTLT